MKIKIPATIMETEIHGEVILLNPDTENFTNLNPTGNRMWQALKETRDTDKSLSILTEIYDADPEILQRDLIQLVQDLAERGLIVVEHE